MREEGDGNLLLERLRIRLGKEAVLASRRHPTTGRNGPGGTAKRAVIQPRPANPSVPCGCCPSPCLAATAGLVLKAGPERIESGWWDGMEVARDYYVAQDQTGARLWVYCERTSGEWFVHGLFA